MSSESNTDGIALLATASRFADLNPSVLKLRSGPTKSQLACGKPMDVTESTVEILSSVAAGIRDPADVSPIKLGVSFRSVAETVKVFLSALVVHNNAVATLSKKTA